MQVEKKAMVNKMDEDEDARRKEISLVKAHLEKVLWCILNAHCILI